MAVTPTTFRVAFPEFADAVKYPDPQVQFYIDLSGKMMNAGRWGELLDFGAQLFVAHNLALQRARILTANAGGTPGQAKGIQTSKSVGSVSVSYDASSVTEEGAGHWNLTIYGQQYYRLMMQIGAGPIESGISSEFPSYMTYIGAWPGPSF